MSIFSKASDFVPVLPANLRGVLGACLDAVGISTASGGSTGGEDRAVLGISAAKRVCLVLVDGLGALNLAERLSYAAHLRAWDRHVISTIAPSTTAAALTALGTGERPGQTAMLSYALRSPATGRSFSLLKWKQAGMRPEEWQRVPTLFEQAASRVADGPATEHNDGMAREVATWAQDNMDEPPVAVVQDPAFFASGLTRASQRGASHLGGKTLAERVDRAAAFLRTGRLAYLYWDMVDHAGHGHGWRSEEWAARLEELDSGLGRLERALPTGTLIVLTADHGMIDVTSRYDIASLPELREGVDLVSGEERCRHLYTRDPEGVRERWQNVLGDDAVVVTKQEAAASGIYGEMSEWALAVCGDVISFQRGCVAVSDSRERGANRPFMKGVHGSLTEAEMRIPLVLHEVGR